MYCPYCQSEKPLWRAGTREQKHKAGRKQQWVCRSCRRHTVNPKRKR